MMNAIRPDTDMALSARPSPPRGAKLLVAAAIASLAAACETPTSGPTSVDATAPATRTVAAPPSSPQAGPGTQIVPPATAGRFFAEACLLTKPSFAAAGAALADDPFTQNSVTTTYYHNTGNLSIKAVPGSCSLVMAVRSPVEGALRAFNDGANATAPNDNSDVSVRPAGNFGDQTMLVFRLTE